MDIDPFTKYTTTTKPINTTDDTTSPSKELTLSFVMTLKVLLGRNIVPTNLKKILFRTKHNHLFGQSF